MFARAGFGEKNGVVRRKVFWGLALTVIALGGWARLASLPSVFTPTGVELLPTDSHYYVRFASRQLETFPRFEDFDPWVNYPEGARIYWPPFHTWAVAAAIALHPEAPEESAAFVGPVLSLLGLFLMAELFRRLLGERVALGALGLFALTPVAVFVGAVGNVDHHVHEPVIAVVCALLLGRALETGRRDLAIWTGVVLGLGRFFNPSVFLLVPCLAGSLLLWALLRRPEAAGVAKLSTWVGASSAVVLSVGALLFGRLELGYEQFSWFQPLWALALFGGAASIAGLAFGSRRWGFGLVFAVALLALLGPELARAFSAFGRQDPLLALVTESQPLWRHPSWALQHFGGALFLAPLGMVGAARHWRRSPTLWPVLVTSSALLAASLLQLRFIQPLVGLWAVLIPAGVAAFADGLRAPVRTGTWAICALFGLSLLPVLERSAAPTSTDEGMVRSAMQWLRQETPASENFAVVASSDLGHLITLWAKRPAVATPFSQAPWHIEGNLRASRVLAAESDEEAFLAAKQSHARYVLLVPFQKILGFPNAKDEKTLARRLLDHAGLDEHGTGHFRLVFDSPEQRLRKEGGSYARVFEIVEGARAVGSAPIGTLVEAQAELRSNLGTRLQYKRSTRAGPDGSFQLLLAYPGRYGVQIGERMIHFEVRESAVRGGEQLDLPSQTQTPPTP